MLPLPPTINLCDRTSFLTNNKKSTAYKNFENRWFYKEMFDKNADPDNF